jgi:flagellar protein FliL
MALDQKDKAGGGIVGFVTAVLLMTGVGAGAGFSLKFIQPVQETKAHQTAQGHDPAGEQGDKKTAPAQGEPATTQILPLEVIVISLAEPKGVRLRLESAVIFSEVSKVDRSVLLREMAQDLVTFIRTVKLAHVESASGIEYLREDLTELIQLRSKGLARGLVIKSLIVE